MSNPPPPYTEPLSFNLIGLGISKIENTGYYNRRKSDCQQQLEQEKKKHCHFLRGRWLVIWKWTVPGVGWWRPRLVRGACPSRCTPSSSWTSQSTGRASGLRKASPLKVYTFNKNCRITVFTGKYTLWNTYFYTSMITCHSWLYYIILDLNC